MPEEVKEKKRYEVEVNLMAAKEYGLWDYDELKEYYKWALINRASQQKYFAADQDFQ